MVEWVNEEREAASCNRFCRNLRHRKALNGAEVEVKRYYRSLIINYSNYLVA